MEYQLTFFSYFLFHGFPFFFKLSLFSLDVEVKSSFLLRDSREFIAYAFVRGLLLSFLN